MIRKFLNSPIYYLTVTITIIVGFVGLLIAFPIIFWISFWAMYGYFIIQGINIIIERFAKIKKGYNTNNKLKDNKPTISFIVCSHEKDDQRRLKQVIENLLESKYFIYDKDKIEVIYAYTGKPLDITHQRLKKIEVNSKYEGLKEGIKIAKGKYIGIIDATCLLIGDVCKAIQLLENDEKIACVQGIREVDPMKRKFFTGWFSEISWKVIMDNKFRRQSLGKFVNFCGSTGIWKKRVLEELGFRPPNETLTEDIEISIRAYLNNYKVVITDSFKSYDYPPRNIMGLIRQRLRWSQGYMESLLCNFRDIIHKKYDKKVKIDLIYQVVMNILLGNYAIIFANASLLAWVVLMINNIPTIYYIPAVILMIWNTAIGIIQFSYSRLAMMLSPMLNTLLGIIQVSAVFKKILKDTDWYKSVK